MKRIAQPLTRSLAIACCLLAAGGGLLATDLTGTFHKPDGTPVNGRLIFLLSQPARLADGSAQVVPMVKIFQVTNGQLEPGAFIYGNDVLLPEGTHYVARLVDNANNLLFEQKWYISGASLDLGTLTPTTVGVVLADPLVKNSPVEQAVEGPVTFTSPVTAFSLTLNGDLNPGAPAQYSLGSVTAPWREVVAEGLRLRGGPWFDITAFGAVCDNVTDDWPALTAAFDAAADSGGGVVLIPPSPTSTPCFLSGGELPPTFRNGKVNPVTIRILGQIRIGTTILIPQRHVHFDGTYGQGLHGSFSPLQMARVTGGVAGQPLFHFRASPDPAPAIPPGTGGLQRTTNTMTRLNLMPNADVDGIWVRGVGGQAEAIVLDGVRIGISGNGNGLWLDSVLWFYMRNNWAILTPANSTGYGIKISNEESQTGLLFFTDGIMAGRLVHWSDTTTQSMNGSIEFHRITTENSTTPFFTYDSTGGTSLAGLKFEEIEMADPLVPQPLIHYVDNGASTGSMRYVWVRKAQGKKDNFRLVEGRNIEHLFVFGDWSTRSLAGGVNAIGQATAGTVMIESSGRIHLGGPNTGFGSGMATGAQMGLLSRSAIGIKVPGTQTSPTTPLAKANLHVADGTDSGLTLTEGNRALALFESSGTSYVHIASGSTSHGGLFFSRSGVPHAGGIEYSHNSNELLLRADNAERMRIGATRTLVFGQLHWFSGGSMLGRMVHSNTANRDYTFPDASGTVGIYRTNTASLDFPEIAAGATAELTITVSDAAVGDACTATPSGAPENGLVWTCYVSGVNTVAVRLGNLTASAINPAARTWRAVVWKQ